MNNAFVHIAPRGALLTGVATASLFSLDEREEKSFLHAVCHSNTQHHHTESTLKQSRWSVLQIPAVSLLQSSSVLM